MATAMPTTQSHAGSGPSTPPPVFPDGGNPPRPAKEMAVGALQVLQALLQRRDGRIGEPCRIPAVAPFGEPLAQSGIAELFLAVLVALFLQRQRLVEHESACPGEAAHPAPPFAAGRHVLS